MKEQIKKLIIDVIKELNYNPDDIELQKYLYEKGVKAIHKIDTENYTLAEVRNLLKENIPTMMQEYVRMKNVIDKKKTSKTSFGVSVNYQLIELFKILNYVSLSDEFEMVKNKYLHSQPVIFPGLLECSYEELQNIYKNIIDNCDIITPEAEAKMSLTINDQIIPFNNDGTVNTKVFNFSYLDIIMDFARQNNMKVKLHTLIWHKHFPKVLENCSYTQIMSFLEAYFSCLSNRYGTDVFYSIDVLNEIVADINSEEFKNGEILRDSKWKEKLGNNYYLIILKLARKYFSNVNLVYNEYDEINLEKRHRMIRLINDIKREEMLTGTTLLNSIGLQSHYNEYTSDEDIKETYKDLSQTGKLLQVSELDVRQINGYDSVQTNRIFRTVLDCATTYNVDYFTFWGPTSSISWKSKKVRTFLNDEGAIDNNVKQIVNTYSQKRKSKMLKDGKSL